MNYSYAQLDSNNICVHVFNSTAFVISENLVQIDRNDTTLIGKQYIGGDWIEPEPQPTNADILDALQKSQQELQQEAIDSYTMELMEQGIL